MMQEKISRKITVLSFIAMICVVMIHSHAIGTIENPASWCVFIQSLFMRTATNWAVPFFFIVSGYFFASRNLNNFKKSGYFRLMRKKYSSLFIPYILWALIGTVISVLLIVLNNYISSRGLFERTFLAPEGCWSKIDLLFGVTYNGPKGNLALWYVMALLLIFLFSPILMVLSKIHRTVLALVGIILSMVFSELPISFLSLKLGAIGWFCMGMGIAQLGIEKYKMQNWCFYAVGAGWVSIAILGALAASNLLEMEIVAEYLLPVCSLLGILFWWGFYDRVQILKKEKLPECFRMTFWVYCLHGVITGWFLASILFLLGKSEWVAMLASGVSICGSLIVSLVAGFLIKRQFPTIYGILSGGR
jgi:surface polysaccharide O-acyltransferase-like enzyme